MRRVWDNPLISIIILIILVIAALAVEVRLGRGIFRAFGRVRLLWRRPQVTWEGLDGYTAV